MLERELGGSERSICDIQCTQLSMQTIINLFVLNIVPRRGCCAALRPADVFSHGKLQILISAEHGTQTGAYSSFCDSQSCNKLNHLGLRLDKKKKLACLCVTAIKNKLQLIPSHASCWWKPYKFLIHSWMCIHLISHVPQKEQIIYCVPARATTTGEQR